MISLEIIERAQFRTGSLVMLSEQLQQEAFLTQKPYGNMNHALSLATQRCPSCRLTKCLEVTISLLIFFFSCYKELVNLLKVRKEKKKAGINAISLKCAVALRNQ